MKSKHIYLNLFAIDMPLTAITSIFHRITGLLLFFFIPLILYIFKLSVESKSSFDMLSLLLGKFHVRMLFTFFLLIFFYHLISGVKHMVMDFGYFESRVGARRISLFSLFIVIIVLFLSILL